MFTLALPWFSHPRCCVQSPGAPTPPLRVRRRSAAVEGKRRGVIRAGARLGLPKNYVSQTSFKLALALGGACTFWRCIVQAVQRPKKLTYQRKPAHSVTRAHSAYDGRGQCVRGSLHRLAVVIDLVLAPWRLPSRSRHRCLLIAHRPPSASLFFPTRSWWHREQRNSSAVVLLLRPRHRARGNIDGTPARRRAEGSTRAASPCRL